MPFLVVQSFLTDKYIFIDNFHSHEKRFNPLETDMFLYNLSNEETFLQDFLKILKQTLHNFCKILKKCFLGTIWKIKPESHNVVLPVAKELTLYMFSALSICVFPLGEKTLLISVIKYLLLIMVTQEICIQSVLLQNRILKICFLWKLMFFKLWHYYIDLNMFIIYMKELMNVIWVI